MARAWGQKKSQRKRKKRNRSVLNSWDYHVVSLLRSSEMHVTGFLSRILLRAVKNTNEQNYVISLYIKMSCKNGFVRASRPNRCKYTDDWCLLRIVLTCRWTFLIENLVLIMLTEINWQKWRSKWVKAKSCQKCNFSGAWKIMANCSPEKWQKVNMPPFECAAKCAGSASNL